MDKNVCVSPKIDGDCYESRVPLKITKPTRESIGQKRKTPNNFETDSGTLCVSKKRNLGDRKSFCMVSKRNDESQHSKLLLNSNTTHEPSVATCTDIMGKAASFASNKAQQVGQIISRKGTSNVASSLIVVNEFGLLVSAAGRCDSCTPLNLDRSTKKAPSCKDLMAHVFVQPKKTVVLVETDVVKVFDNTNAENISRPPAMPRTGRAQKQQCKDTYRHMADVKLPPVSTKVPLDYIYLGKCTCVCRYCGAMFWECEKVAKLSSRTQPEYNKCCHGGRVILPAPPDYPQYIKQLYRDPHFMKNIRAYNQMFSMTSLGANVDNSINNGKGPYVFRISGQLYHWIGSMCPDEGAAPRFLQLYIYDTANEVKNRMAHFGGEHESGLKKEIVEGLIEFLDNHNALVQLFRTARDKYLESDIPDFKVKLYNVVGTRQYELPTPDTVGAIVFGGSALTENDFDLIVEEHSRYPQRVNKLHPCYMSLQFPLLFVYGEEGYHKGLKMADSPRVTTKVIKSIYGSDGGFKGSRVRYGGVWADIIRNGHELDGLDRGFVNHFCKEMVRGNGVGIGLVPLEADQRGSLKPLKSYC
ncbi:hypothetical protein Tco_0110206 [Tanacetum coccineum]